MLSSSVLRTTRRQTSRGVVELGLRAVKLSLRRGKLSGSLLALRIELGLPSCQLIGRACGLRIDLRDSGLQLRGDIGQLRRTGLL